MGEMVRVRARHRDERDSNGTRLPWCVDLRVMDTKIDGTLTLAGPYENGSSLWFYDVRPSWVRRVRSALPASKVPDRNTRPEPHGEARSRAEEPFWLVCRDGNEGRLRRALDDAWAAAGGRPLVWATEFRPSRGR